MKFFLSPVLRLPFEPHSNEANVNSPDNSGDDGVPAAQVPIDSPAQERKVSAAEMCAIFHFTGPLIFNLDDHCGPIWDDFVDVDLHPCRSFDTMPVDTMPVDTTPVDTMYVNTTPVQSAATNNDESSECSSMDGDRSVDVPYLFSLFDNGQSDDDTCHSDELGSDDNSNHDDEVGTHDYSFERNGGEIETQTDDRLFDDNDYHVGTVIRLTDGKLGSDDHVSTVNRLSDGELGTDDHLSDGNAGTDDHQMMTTLALMIITMMTTLVLMIIMMMTTLALMIITRMTTLALMIVTTMTKTLALKIVTMMTTLSLMSIFQMMSMKIRVFVWWTKWLPPHPWLYPITDEDPEDKGTA